jgi:hypothetical protein
MTAPIQTRFGIAEWYGTDFTRLSPERRHELAVIQPRRCPFLSTSTRDVACSKAGGVCSIRQYQKMATGQVIIHPTKGSIHVTCPYRFEQQRSIYQWIGEVVLGEAGATPIGQVNFLERVPRIGEEEWPEEAREGVGRFDNVMIVPDTDPLRWCPVEIQAVYFSGDKMESEFAVMRGEIIPSLPFPVGRRRPDYRSSGPKRLMPQLQIKVPTLRRWGKKMAVVVDRNFFQEMGRINTTSDLSNCDVAWFVVGFDDNSNLIRHGVFFATLEESVSGLIAGRPVTQVDFETRIRNKLLQSATNPR